MDFLDAAVLSIKNCLISLLAGTFVISFAISIISGPDGMTMLLLFLVSLLIGVLPVTLIGAPLYAGLLSADAASYFSAGLVAILISAPTYFFGDISFVLLFAAYGVPIALFAHFLATRERKTPPRFESRPLRG